QDGRSGTHGVVVARESQTRVVPGARNIDVVLVLVAGGKVDRVTYAQVNGRFDVALRCKAPWGTRMAQHCRRAAGLGLGTAYAKGKNKCNQQAYHWALPGGNKALMVPLGSHLKLE